MECQVAPCTQDVVLRAQELVNFFGWPGRALQLALHAQVRRALRMVRQPPAVPTLEGEAARSMAAARAVGGDVSHMLAARPADINIKFP